jgi:hypothetical protein
VLAHPGAQRVERKIFFRLFFGHPIPALENLETFGHIVDRQRRLATAFRHPEDGVLEAIGQERLRDPRADGRPPARRHGGLRP